MKKQMILMAMATSIALFAGCSKDEVTPSTGSSNQLAVSMASITTKAGTSVKTVWAANNEIGVFVTGTGYTPAVTNYKTSDGTAWTFSTAPVYLIGNPASVYAVYPANTQLSGTTPDATSTFTASVPATDDFAASGATDYMWGIGTKTVSNATGDNATVITMKHAFSKVSFIINKDVNYPTTAGTGNITGITLSSAGNKIVTGGSVIVGTGVFTPATYNTGDLQYTPSAATYINAYNATTPSAVVTATLLACPVAYASADLALSLTIDGKTMPVTNFPTSPDWHGYCDYQYTITVSPTSLAVTSVTITAWTPTPITGTPITAQ